MEFGVENGTVICKDCSREFYLKLKSKVKIPEDYKQKYNITDNYAYSVIIPNKEYKEMWKIELYDNDGNRLDIPIQLWYLSGTIWKKYPPSIASLSLSTIAKRFKVTAILPDDIVVSGKIGLKFKLFNQDIDTSFDPIWWINGNPVEVKILQDCKTYSKSAGTNRVVKSVYYLNQTICSDVPINKSCQSVNYLNFTYDNVIGYYEILNTTICKNIGFNIRNKIIDFAEVEWKCSRNNLVICCEAQHQSNQDGKCSSGEGYCIFNIATLEKECTVSKTRQIGELNVK